MLVKEDKLGEENEKYRYENISTFPAKTRIRKCSNGKVLDAQAAQRALLDGLLAVSSERAEGRSSVQYTRGGPEMREAAKERHGREGGGLL